MRQVARIEKAETIVNELGVRLVAEGVYKVRSQSLEQEYDVAQKAIGLTCSCQDFQSRGLKCKHILAVEISFQLKQEQSPAVKVLRPLDICCKFCGSNDMVKNALRHNQYGNVQRWRCNACGKRFSTNIGFEGMRASPQSIISAMQLYFTGESCRSVKEFLKLQEVNVSRQTIWNWINKYMSLMSEYADKLTPLVSDKWRTDELYIKMKGEPRWLFSMIDDKSRYWIALQVAKNKGTSDVRPLFREAQEIAGKKPKVLISDGAPNFEAANRREWRTLKKEGRVEHIRDINLSNPKFHNNKMERFNGELRDREKVMRGLKTPDTPIIKGMQVFHNFFRPHDGLEGATPSEKAGIQIEDPDKMMTFQNAITRKFDSQEYHPPT